MADPCVKSAVPSAMRRSSTPSTFSPPCRYPPAQRRTARRPPSGRRSFCPPRGSPPRRASRSDPSGSRPAPPRRYPRRAPAPPVGSRRAFPARSAPPRPPPASPARPARRAASPAAPSARAPPPAPLRPPPGTSRSTSFSSFSVIRRAPHSLIFLMTSKIEPSLLSTTATTSSLKLDGVGLAPRFGNLVAQPSMVQIGRPNFDRPRSDPAVSG